MNAPADRVSRWHKKLHVATKLEDSEALEVRFRAALKGKGAVKVAVMDSSLWSNEKDPNVAIRLVRNDSTSAFEVDYLDSQNVKWRARVPIDQEISAPNIYRLKLNPASATSAGSLSLKLNSTIILEEAPLASKFEKLTD